MRGSSGSGSVKRKALPPPAGASPQIPPAGGPHPDPPAVALDDPLADREPEPGAGDAVAAQAVEHLEDQLALGGIDADAVVDDGDLPAVVEAPRGDVHDGPRGAGELDGVRDEVL